MTSMTSTLTSTASQAPGNHVRKNGFTLIELLIVVAIVAILAAIALPSYYQYVVRTHRTDAQRVLMDTAARQERYFYDNNAYASSLSDLGMAASSGGEYYTLSIASASSSNFTVRATPVGSQSDDTQCGYLELTRAGERSAQGSGTRCWGS